MKTLFYSYECGYGLEDHNEDPNHMRLIKRGCLAHFSIKRLYTRQDVVEIIFYHRTHNLVNGDHAHGAMTQGPHHGCQHMLHMYFTS
jgi:hypothetical protein